MGKKGAYKTKEKEANVVYILIGRGQWYLFYGKAKADKEYAYAQREYPGEMALIPVPVKEGAPPPGQTNPGGAVPGVLLAVQGGVTWTA